MSSINRTDPCKPRTINLLPEDAQLLEKIQDVLRKKEGKLSFSAIARRALWAFAEKEGIND